MAGLKRAALGAEGTAYEADISAWAEEQARHLRSGRWSQLDILNLADEIEAVSRTERHALTSALRLILLHMLKWDYQPSRRSRSWTVTIRTQRLAVAEQIEDSPSLRAQLGRLMDRAYDRARIEAASETMLDEATFPPACSYDLADVMERQFPWPSEPSAS